jgi:proteasome accessory factor B
MSARRTERLLNLVIALLATRRWLTKEQIRAAVPQYADGESAEAFDRMFERDKEDLRELGVPIVTGTDSAWFDDEVGYRIDRDAYALPPVQLDAEELAVLGLASRVWQQASLSGPAASALLKLSALGLEPDEGSLVGVEPRIRTAEPAFEALYNATRLRTPVAFSYRKPDGSVSERHLEPWAVISRGGRWYVGGRDRDRDAPRVFRLSRIDSAVSRIGRAGSYAVPVDLDPKDLVAPMRQQPDERRARLRVRPGRGVTLRRRALQVAEAGEPAGWDDVTVQVGDPTALAEELAGYGPDVVVVAPEDLRQAVIRRLQAALANSGAAPVPAPAATPRETAVRETDVREPDAGETDSGETDSRETEPAATPAGGPA